MRYLAVAIAYAMLLQPVLALSTAARLVADPLATAVLCSAGERGDADHGAHGELCLAACAVAGTLLAAPPEAGALRAPLAVAVIDPPALVEAAVADRVPAHAFARGPPSLI